MMNLQYEIRICHKIHNKGTMSQWLIQVTIFLSGTDVRNFYTFICTAGLFSYRRVFIYLVKKYRLENVGYNIYKTGK